jgi:hypothetical protein
MTSMGVSSNTDAAPVGVSENLWNEGVISRFSPDHNADGSTVREDYLDFDPEKELATVRATAVAFAQPVLVDSEGRLTINEAGMVFGVIYPVRIADGLYHVVLSPDATVEIYEVLE